MIANERILRDLSLNDSLVFYAFRYCLHAHSYAVGECATYLVQHWQNLLLRVQHHIHQELRAALDAGHTPIRSTLPCGTRCCVCRS